MQKNEAENNIQIMSSRNAQQRFGKNKAGREGKYMYMYMNSTHLKVNKRKVGWRKHKISMESILCVRSEECSKTSRGMLTGHKTIWAELSIRINNNRDRYYIE